MNDPKTTRVALCKKTLCVEMACGKMLLEAGDACLEEGGPLEVRSDTAFSPTTAALCAEPRGNSLTFCRAKRLEISRTLNYRFGESEKQTGMLC